MNETIYPYYCLTKAEQSLLNKILHKDKMSSLISALIWSVSILAGIAAVCPQIKTQREEVVNFLMAMSVLALAGVPLLIKSFHKIFFFHPCNFKYTRGICVSTERDWLNENESYLANIKLNNETVIVDLPIDRNLNLIPGSDTFIVYNKRRKIKYIICPQTESWQEY